ncbi:hypothetical protein [uncultured Erythrobacter sp.]|uniref:ComEC/Rec2 family competence protein n=1 Tax=uncultured Erythrobacter sp. TaxID=263913 RepID=UPI002618EB3B|nr:hypothetical protein [uncultured Erythrobacter sp.]
MELEVLPARHGDCMLLHFGSDDAPKIALIDGGPAGVYNDTLLPRLQELREERGLPENQPLVIEMLIISHIDDDHVNGVIRLLRDMKKDADNGDPPRFRIRRLWHNSFDDIIGNSETESRAALNEQFGTASAGAQDIPEDLLDDHCDWQVLASISQGHQIRELAESLGIPANPDFGGNLIQAPDSDDDFLDQIELDGVTFTVLGPLTRELKDLEEKHDKWLRKEQKKRDSGEATLAAFDDTSVANLSSIVLLADDGDKQYLLTGDARGDKIIEAFRARDDLGETAGEDGAERCGECGAELDDDGRAIGAASATSGDKVLSVDLLKVPHHGSDRNVTVGFFEAIPASTYVLSGNGGHGNPERDCLEWIEEARAGKPYTLQFTYSLEAIDAKRKRLMENGHHAGDEPFDPAKHGVGAFVESLPDRVKVVAPESD